MQNLPSEVDSGSEVHASAVLMTSCDADLLWAEAPVVDPEESAVALHHRLQKHRQLVLCLYFLMHVPLLFLLPHQLVTKTMGVCVCAEAAMETPLHSERDSRGF